MKTVKNDQLWFEFESYESIFAGLNLKHFDEPKNDKERLFNAQYDFIKSKFRDQKAETELYILSERVCKNLIKKRLKKEGYTYYTAEDIQMKAEIATDYWIRRYKNNWNSNRTIYYITDGFIVTLDFAVQYALFYVGRDDLLDKIKQMESLDDEDHADYRLNQKSLQDWQEGEERNEY